MTSSKNISWFHCGQCGSLFQSAAGAFGHRCSECGQNPSPVVALPQRNVSDTPKRTRLGTSEKPRARDKKPSYSLLTKLVVICATLIFLIFLKVVTLLNEDPPRSDDPTIGESQVSDVNAEKSATLLNQGMPACNRAISQFISSGTPEGRNQYVLAPVATAARMAEFYKLNPLLSLDASTLSQTRAAVLHLPSGDAIEANFSSKEGLQLDSVFVKENGEWRLDWDHFARYSTHPWPLFLAGGGDAHGEFRLLARRRLAEEMKDADAISIVFYAPHLGHPSELGSHSPEFLVPRDSKNGRLLEAAFKLEKAGKRAFGVELASNEPEGIIRVRVKVRRVDENDERHFELEEVVACHWYSTDEPGLEVSD